MNHLDLFSGIGGFALAASWVWGEEHHIHSFVEIEPFCQKILKKHWPEIPIISDIRDVTYETIANPTIDLLTGGFPCQPFSSAGKRNGRSDNRYLWPEMLRVIKEIKPRWIIAENVPGLLSIEKGMVFEQVCLDLEGEGYEVWPFSIPACGVDAPHKRERIWIVGRAKFLAHPLSNTKGGSYGGESGECERGWKEQNRSERNEVGCDTPDRSQDVADSTQELFNRSGGSRPAGGSEYTDRRVIEGFKRTSRKSSWLPEPDVGRVANGVPSRVDRLKGLGNAIVPQCVAPIMQAIKEIEDLI